MFFFKHVNCKKSLKSPGALIKKTINFPPLFVPIQQAQVPCLRMRHLAQIFNRRIESSMLGPGFCRALLA